MYKNLDHMTDLLIEVKNETLELCFADAALAVMEASYNPQKVVIRGSRHITVDEKDLDYLLFEWLEDIVMLIITDGFAPKVLSLKLDKKACTIDATFYGEEFDMEKHEFRVEIKAATLHEMEIREDKNGAYMKFLMDL